MPTTGIMNGSLLRLYADGVAIAYSTSDTIDLTRAMRELAHKDNTSAWVEVAPGQKSASFSTEILFADRGDTSSNTKFDILYGYFNAGSLISCTYTSDVLGDSVITFNAYIESLSLNSANQENSSASITLKINGAVYNYTKALPLIVTGVTASNITSSAVTITYVAPADNNAQPVTNYVVYYTKSGGSAQTLAGTSTALTRTITGLDTGSNYSITVRAVNPVGNGPLSTAISVTTL